MENISVTGLWRNSSEHIKRTLTSLESIEEVASASYFFYENDSSDDTKEILEEWLHSRTGSMISENLELPKFGSVMSLERLMLMAYYRNKCASQLKDVETEYTLMIDTDVEFSRSDFEILLEEIKSLDCSMVVANTRQPQIRDFVTGASEDSFYDVSALKDKYFNRGIFFSDCPLVLEEDRKLWYSGKPVKISAGFSGFALVKTDFLKKCKWSTQGEIEHVNLCTELREFGDIYISSRCRPKTYFDPNNVNLEAVPDVGRRELEKIATLQNVNHVCIAENLLDVLKIGGEQDSIGC